MSWTESEHRISMKLFLSLAVLVQLAICAEVAGALKEKEAVLQSDDEEGPRSNRRHFSDRHHPRHGSHHDRHHSRHGSHEDHNQCRRRRRHHHRHQEHGDCPPCDLSVCTTKCGNFTVITRPVTWDQAANSCAMIGLRLAHINIENFMDATKAAFQCSGPFSQSWVHSWNGDAYDGKGLVLSTGNAAPGGAINEVVDANSGRNVICEVSDEPVKKPDCHQGNRGCGCNRPECPSRPCGCGKNPIPRPEPVLHSKMKCLRCFCRRNVECPLQEGPTINPIRPIRPIRPVRPTGFAAPSRTGNNIVAPTSTRPSFQGPSFGRPSNTGGRPTSMPTPPAKATDEQKEAGSVEKALKAVGRFIQLPYQQDQNQIQAQEKNAEVENKKLDDEDEENGDEDHDDQDHDDEGHTDEEDEQEDYEVEQVIFDDDAKSLEKGFPFEPETCGAQCVCYACKDYEPERHHHRRCRRRSRHNHHRVYERPQPIDDLKKAAIQLKSLRQIVAFDETGKQVEQKTIDADQDLKIQIL